MEFEDLPKLQGTAIVELTVNDSSILIEVDGNNAPITAGNFVDLVERGVYDNVPFHRVIKEPEPFVVQGGDPQGQDPNFPIENLGTGGFIDPETGEERNIPLEIKLEGDDEPTYNTLLGDSDVVLKHELGSIAMARAEAPDSASSQFYFALDELESLDGNYAVFGEVIEGLDVVTEIEQGDRIEDAEVISKTLFLEDAEGDVKTFFKENGGGELEHIYYETFSDNNRAIDTELTQSVLDLGTDANFDNIVGFYEIVNADGGIDVNGEVLLPGDQGYARAAIENRVTDWELRAGSSGDRDKNTSVDDFGIVSIDSNRQYAPFVIANGGSLGFDGFIDAEDREDDGEFNEAAQTADDAVAYFSFIGANPDNARHLESNGDGVFGFEDLPVNLSNVSDNDFNDAVFQFDFV
jgi:peptidyl-prolyl cis-trans isomerase B (cyclophilin B)